MDTSDFTIGIPIFNDAKYIRATLDSCVKQASNIVIYDNCSTDESTAICAEYAAKYPNIKHVIHAENLGNFVNFGQLALDCKTEYFMWLGAHDLLSENYVEVLLNDIRKHPDAALIVPKVLHINEDGSFRKKVTDMSKWSSELQTQEDPLLRMAAFIKDHFGSKKHDSLILQGIFRTKVLQKSWIPQACIAFDDAVLANAAAYGKIIYNNDAEYFARWFKKTRKKADEPKRIFHGGKIPAGGAMSRSILVIEVMKTILGISEQRGDIKDVFKLTCLVQKYVESPRRARKSKNRKIIAAIIVALIAGVSLCVF